jgi:hypothetical protein
MPASSGIQTYTPDDLVMSIMEGRTYNSSSGERDQWLAETPGGIMARVRCILDGWGVSTAHSFIPYTMLALQDTEQIFPSNIESNYHRLVAFCAASIMEECGTSIDLVWCAKSDSAPPHGARWTQDFGPGQRRDVPDTIPPTL